MSSHGSLGSPEPLTATPSRQVGRAVFTQTWADLALLHWPVDAEQVAPLLPPGTVPDLYDGTTWVGLIPFSMRRVGIVGTPPLPYLSRFAETNVRLYAVDSQGRRGVVFRSLEASRLLPVLAARTAYRLPYCWARMSVTTDGDIRSWTTSRRWPGPPWCHEPAVGSGRRGNRRRHRPAAVPHRPVGLFSRWYGGTAYAPVHHDAWPLRAASVLELSDDLVSAAGLSVEGPAPSVLFSPGVTVRIGRPELLPRS